MMLPVPVRSLHPMRSPYTWGLLLLNLFVFLSTFEFSAQCDERIEDLLSQNQQVQTQGYLFAQYLLQNPKQNPEWMLHLAERTRDGDAVALRGLETVSFRSVGFDHWLSGSMIKLNGDAVALESWVEWRAKLLDIQSEHPAYRLGLSERHSQPANWVSYQFTHGSAVHLLWNMIFLLLFGARIETRWGSHVVVGIYVMGGLCGAAAYVWLSGLNLTPLVGASAAITALMGATLWPLHRRVHVYQWVLPSPRLNRFRHVPAWMLVVLYLLPDLGSYLSIPQGLGAVAHAAHIGGALFGCVYSAIHIRFLLGIVSHAPPPSSAQ